MQFEFDPEKSANNVTKHGIDFDAAQALWDDDYLHVAPATTIDEERFLAIGKIKTQHWTAIYTYRNTNIRLISVRRSRKEEIGYYECS
jgi:uncharacterized protein